MNDSQKDDLKNKEEAAQTTSPIQTKLLKKNTKKFSMIKAFVEVGESGVNCFEAVKFHDYVLRTTVSDLQKSCGLKFSRKKEKVQNAFGKTTECKRYWLDDDNIKIAKELIGRDNESEVMQ